MEVTLEADQSEVAHLFGLLGTIASAEPVAGIETRLQICKAGQGKSHKTMSVISSASTVDDVLIRN